jgi:hypothetical protein
MNGDNSLAFTIRFAARDRGAIVAFVRRPAP